MPKVVCTALSTETGPHFEILQNAGFECVVVDRTKNIFQYENLLPEVKDCVGVIAGAEPWPDTLIKQCPQLRVLSRTGVGFDAIDLASCDKNGVVVATTPGVNHHSVAEHTMAMLFAASRLFPKRDMLMRQCNWVREATPRIMGSTIGLIGLGRIGRAVVTRARGVGMNVVAYDPFPNKEFCEQWNVEVASIEDVLKRSDYVSLHLPADAQTKHLMNDKTFAMMKPGSVFINTARGALVDEAALVKALTAGNVRAAGLDVFEVEPLPNTSPLLKLDNVIMSGHVAGLDVESLRDTLIMSAETIVTLRDGGWPTECVRNLVGCKNWTWKR